MCISTGNSDSYFFSGSNAPYELRNLTKTVCQHNYAETSQQNFVKEQFISLLNLGQNYFVQLRLNWFSVRLPVTNACFSLYTAFSSNVGALGVWACSLFLSLLTETVLIYLLKFCWCMNKLFFDFGCKNSGSYFFNRNRLPTPLLQ